MNMKTIKRIGALAVCALAALPSLAQQTYQEMEQLTINENVTTVITASEPVRFVDISTDAVVGDQPINNAVQKTSNAISKAIKKNNAKLKYGTFVYLINSRSNKKDK